MQKTLLLPLVMVLLFVSACNKRVVTEPFITANTWQHDSVFYKATYSHQFVVGNYISITFLPAESLIESPGIQFSFYKNLPTQNRSYTLTDSPKNENEMSIQAWGLLLNNYISSSTSKTCEVYVGTNGKLSFRANNIPLQYDNQTLNYSFNLSEF